MNTIWTGIVLLASAVGAPPSEGTDLFTRGEGVDLDQVIPANERGIVCLALGDRGQVYGGTTGRAAHLFVFDPDKNEARNLLRLEGGIGFSYGLVRLPDGSLIAGTQADPTGIAVRTDPKAVGRLYRFSVSADGKVKVEDLGVPVPGQGIHSIAYLAKTGEVVGNTWPDGHFFTYEVKTKTAKDHGPIAGYRTFETPKHADDVNRGTGQTIRYPRQVSRAIAVDEKTGAYTAGASGWLHRYDAESRKLEKLAVQLPAAAGREPWASLDAAVAYPRSGEMGEYTCIVGGTSDGHLIELRVFGKDKLQLRPRGKPFAQPGVQALAAIAHRKQGAGHASHTVVGVSGNSEGMPRVFAFNHGDSSSSVIPGGIPRVNGQQSMVGFGAFVFDEKGILYAGESDRIARLVRYRLDAPPPAKPTPRKPVKPEPIPFDSPPKLDCHIVFAPEGTTTDGSGYTAIEVGHDGRVYVGAARYGDYGWLLRFDPAGKPLFMDKLVGMQQLTGERLQGINTQGKIHAKILVGADGRIWFASKQAHEIFDTRPEYEDPAGYPGGHLCFFDPKTGFSKSLGILKRHEGLMAGAIDDARGKLYFRSEPKNDFLVHDLKTGAVQDRGHVGSAGRYMARDTKGAVWTTARGPYLCRYDPETGYVEDVRVKLEGEGTYTAPYVLLHGPNGKLYGGGFGHSHLLEFDSDSYRPGPFPEVTVRNVARAAPPGMPMQNLHAAVFGKDGKLYYPLNTAASLEKGGKPVPHLRIMRFDPATKKVETVGVPNIVGLDESKVKHTYVRVNQDTYKLDHMQGAAVGPDGSLYLLDIYPQLNVACFPKLTAGK